jgi:hypothetical protein
MGSAAGPEPHSRLDFRASSPAFDN